MTAAGAVAVWELAGTNSSMHFMAVRPAAEAGRRLLRDGLLRIGLSREAAGGGAARDGPAGTRSDGCGVGAGAAVDVAAAKDKADGVAVGTVSSTMQGPPRPSPPPLGAFESNAAVAADTAGVALGENALVTGSVRELPPGPPGPSLGTERQMSGEDCGPRNISSAIAAAARARHTAEHVCVEKMQR